MNHFRWKVHHFFLAVVHKQNVYRPFCGKKSFAEDYTTRGKERLLKRAELAVFKPHSNSQKCWLQIIANATSDTPTINNTFAWVANLQMVFLNFLFLNLRRSICIEISCERQAGGDLSTQSIFWCLKIQLCADYGETGEFSLETFCSIFGLKIAGA